VDKDTIGDDKRLFGANLASVPLRLFRSKPLPTRNIILVQDKARCCETPLAYTSAGNARGLKPFL